VLRINDRTRGTKTNVMKRIKAGARNRRAVRKDFISRFWTPVRDGFLGGVKAAGDDFIVCVGWVMASLRLLFEFFS